MATIAADRFPRPGPPAQPQPQQEGLALTYHRLMLMMLLSIALYGMFRRRQWL